VSAEATNMGDDPHQSSAEDAAEQEANVDGEAVEQRRQADEEYEEEQIQQGMADEGQKRYNDAREETNPNNRRDEEPRD